MASDYPANYDELGLPGPTDMLDDPDVQHDQEHVAVAEAAMATQHALGLNPQGVYATVRARLEALSASIAAIIAGSPNLLADGTFADGVDGWTAVGTGVTVERTAVDPLDGTHALLVTCDGSHDPGAVTVERDLTGLTVGQMYEVAISVETRTGTPSLSLDVGGLGMVSANSITPEEGWYRRMVVRWYPSASDETIHVTEGTGAACAFAIDVAMVHVATDLTDQLDETVEFLTNAPEFLGPLTVLPAEGSPDEGLHRYSVRDEDTWDEFAADSDVTATADGGTRARGTLDAPEAVELGDILRYLWWREGHDGTGYSIASVAYLQVDDDVSEGIVPTALVVQQADAAGVLQETLRIASDGTLTLPHASSHATGGSDALSPSDIGAVRQRPAIPVGNYWSTTTYSASLSLSSQGLVRYGAFWNPHEQTISDLAIYVSSAAPAGGLLRLGLYSPHANGYQPGALIVDAGTVDSTTTGWKVVTGLSAVLPEGLIFLATGVQGTGTGACSMYGGPGVLLSTSVAPSSGAEANYYQAGVTGALPSTATPSGSLTASAVTIATLRRSA